MGRQLVRVTEEDIKLGLQGNCWKCPVARAISRVLGNAFVIVAPSKWRSRKGYNDWNDTKLGKLPRSAVRFIANFDFGKPVRPFNFYLVEEDKKYWYNH